MELMKLLNSIVTSRLKINLGLTISRIWVYAKGKLEMGGFVNLMERIEYIGKEIVYKEEDGK